MAGKLREDTQIYLIDHYSSQITGIKVPSNNQALQVLLFHLKDEEQCTTVDGQKGTHMMEKTTKTSN